MRVAPEVFDPAESAGVAAAEIIVGRLERANRQQQPFVLGCPGGRSGTTTYCALGRMAGERQLDLSQVIVAMMDDYLVEDATGSLVHEDASALHSCIRFGREQVVAVLSAGVPAGRRIPADHLWFPDPEDPADYDRRIEAAGVSICSFWPRVPATVMSRSTRPARRRTRGRASSPSPQHPA